MGFNSKTDEVEERDLCTPICDSGVHPNRGTKRKKKEKSID